MASSVETLIRSAVSKGIMKVAEFNRDRMTNDAPNPFLTGIHKPMESEKSLADLSVTGTIPPELDGRYIRIGPNPLDTSNPATYHWFVGDGMVHGVRLSAGKALWYRNRWVRSNAVSAALGEAPAPGQRASGFDTVNTNVLGHAGQTWAIVEAGGYPVRIDEELNTIAHDPFGGTLRNAFTAHPHTDPDTGEMHAITYKGDVADTVWHVVVDQNGKVRREEPIQVSDGPMIHDSMITKNYVIILDLNVTFSMKALLGGQRFPYRWNDKHSPRIGLLPRDGTDKDVIWCAVDPCQIFHSCNAFETDDGKVIFDAVVHDSVFAKSTYGPDSSKAPFERWTIDPALKSVSRRVVDAESQEFPRPDERQMGKAYRYAYAIALGNGDEIAIDQTRLFKHDLETGTKQVHDFGRGRIPGEFVFVPRGPGEDEGWLMGYVVDMNSQTTDLAILDAAKFTDKPVALVHIPHRIPPGFHGNWVAS